jgi:DNA-binding response OmpR family regulator
VQQRPAAAAGLHPLRRRVARKRRGPARVLIIEDQALVAHLMEEVIRDFGFQVAGVAYGLREARTALSSYDFDIVLVDLRLGHDSADEIIDALMERGTPLAIVTGFDHPLEPRHANVPLLHKPFSEGQLFALLTRLVGVPEAPLLQMVRT